VARKTDFSVQNTRLEYYGICRECRKEETSTTDCSSKNPKQEVRT